MLCSFLAQLCADFCVVFGVFSGAVFCAVCGMNLVQFAVQFFSFCWQFFGWINCTGYCCIFGQICSWCCAVFWPNFVQFSVQFLVYLVVQFFVQFVGWIWCNLLCSFLGFVRSFVGGCCAGYCCIFGQFCGCCCAVVLPICVQFFVQFLCTELCIFLCSIEMLKVKWLWWNYGKRYKARHLLGVAWWGPMA